MNGWMVATVYLGIGWVLLLGLSALEVRTSGRGDGTFGVAVLMILWLPAAIVGVPLLLWMAWMDRYRRMKGRAG